MSDEKGKCESGSSGSAQLISLSIVNIPAKNPVFPWLLLLIGDLERSGPLSMPSCFLIHIGSG